MLHCTFDNSVRVFLGRICQNGKVCFKLLESANGGTYSKTDVKDLLSCHQTLSLSIQVQF